MKSLEAIDLEDIIDGLATDISAEEDQSEIAAVFVLATAKAPDEENQESSSSKDEQGVSSEDLTQKKEIEDESINQDEDNRNQLDVLPSSSRPVSKTFMSKAAFVLGKILIHVKKLKRGDVKAILGLRKNIALVAVVLLIVLAFSGAITILNKFQKKK